MITFISFILLTLNLSFAAEDISMEDPSKWTDIKMVNVRTWLPSMDDIVELDFSSDKFYLYTFGEKESGFSVEDRVRFKENDYLKGLNGFARQKIYKNPNLSEKPYGEMIVRLGNDYKKFVKDGHMVLSLTAVPDVGANDGGSAPDSKMASARFFSNDITEGPLGDKVNYFTDRLIWQTDQSIGGAQAPSDEGSKKAKYLLLKGVIKKSEGTWIQLPIEVNKQYPWVLVKGFEEKSLEIKSVKGNHFWFSLGPEYVESEDGKTIFLMNHDLRDKFKGKVVKLIDYKRDPWGLYFGEKVENGYLYFKLPINYRTYPDDALEILKKEPDKLYRISLKDLMLSNGNLRVEISRNIRSSAFQLPITFSNGTIYGEGEFAPKNLSAKELILKIYELRKNKKTLTEQDVKLKSQTLSEDDVVW